MNETLPLLLSVCAVLVVVGGLIVIGGFLVLRFLSRRAGGLPLGILGGLSSAFRSEGEEEEVDTSRPTRGRRLNVENLAASVDFDAALARQGDDNSTTGISAQQAQPGQQQPKRGNAGAGRILRSGHDTPSSPSGARPATQGPDQDFQQIGEDSSSSDLGTTPDRPLRQRRRRRRDGNEDEVFGGMLDDDGDGEFDF